MPNFSHIYSTIPPPLLFLSPDCHACTFMLCACVCVCVYVAIIREQYLSGWSSFHLMFPLLSIFLENDVNHCFTPLYSWIKHTHTLSWKMMAGMMAGMKSLSLFFWWRNWCLEHRSGAHPRLCDSQEVPCSLLPASKLTPDTGHFWHACSNGQGEPGVLEALPLTM